MGATTYGAFCVGLALSIAIFAFGWVGAAAFNPAVAIVLAVRSNTTDEFLDLIGLIISEFLGGFAAYGIVTWAENLNYKLPSS